MYSSIRVVTTLFIFALITGCTTYSGDNALQLTTKLNTFDEAKLLTMAKSDVSEIIASLKLSEKERAKFERISPESVYQRHDVDKILMLDSQLLIANGDTTIPFASHSIIISNGSLQIAHSSNNIVISNGDIDISHDGSQGDGSLILSKGKIHISHAHNSLIYAVKGLEISHARYVRAFNTQHWKTSFGHINNTSIPPLFHDEVVADKRDNKD